MDLRPADPGRLEGGLVAMTLVALGPRRGRRAAFELVGAQVPQGRMATGRERVVPPFQVFENGHARFGLNLERASVDELAFERCEEAFGHRVVVAITGRFS